MEEILSKIGFDYRVALANLVNFLIVFWVLYRFAFPKIQAVLSERQAKIHKGLQDAEDAAKAKLDAQDLAKKSLDDARAEARGIVSDGESEAKKIVEKAHGEGEIEKGLLVASAQKVIDAEKMKAENDLKNQGQSLVESALKNVFANDVSDEQHQAYAKKVASYIHD